MDRGMNQLIDKLAELLLGGAYVLSDNDGTLSPFTQTADQTVIPVATLAQLDRFQEQFGKERFIIVTGRDRQAMRALIARSRPGGIEMPLVTDDGGLYTWKETEESILSRAEKDFMAFSQERVRGFLSAVFENNSGMDRLIGVEFKGSGININLNELHAQKGEEAANAMNARLRMMFEDICEGAPLVDGKAAFAIHKPPGHGIEIRSTLTTKKQGVASLITKGIIPEDSKLVLFIDDIKKGGNDVEIARMVQERGGFVVQIKHPGTFRDYPDSDRVITPDIQLHGSEAIAGLLEQTIDRVLEIKRNRELDKSRKPATLQA